LAARHNTGATFVTVLMVFFIQKTHNATLRQTLDELNQSHERSASMMLDLEHMDDESLECLRDIYERLAVGKGG
jgi:low affinity Fe/Cu permease